MVILSNQWSFSGTFLNAGSLTVTNAGISFPECSSNYDVNTNLLNATNTTAWWVSGGNGSTNANAPATYFATNVLTLRLSNGQVSILPPITGRFNMYRPVAKISPVTNAVEGTQGPNDTGLLNFGDRYRGDGITFSNTIAYPTLFPGSNFWVQVLTSSGAERIMKTNSGVVLTTVEQGEGPTFLDNNLTADNSLPPYPYLFFASDNITPVDSPAEDLESTEQWFRVNAESFQMTMMCNPPGVGVPVPVRTVTWGWSGSAVNVSYGSGYAWSPRTGPNPLTSTVNPDSDTTNYPVWMSYATNCLWEPQQ
jgi:hypothetical protein